MENVVDINDYKNNDVSDYIITPFKEKVDNKNFSHSTGVMKIITGLTGQGKTYSTAKELIPYLANEKNVDLFIVSVPQTEILDKEDFVRYAVQNNIHVVEKIDEAIRYAKIGVKVLLLTSHQGLVVAPRGKEFLDYLQNSGIVFSIFIDEAHTWLISHVNNYRDVNGNTTPDYEATLFKKLDQLS